VSSVLLDAGHDVRPVTLSGVGNRADDTDVTLQTHVDDIVIGDWSKPHPGRTLTDPAQLTGDVADLTTTYVTCLLDGAEPDDDVKGLLSSRHWRLVELETGHWPMYSVPTELADVLLSVA